MDTLPGFQSEARLWTVAEITRYIRQALESDYRLQDLRVVGEASNVSHAASGHLYFTLKDEQAALRCVMWRPHVLRLARLPRDGEALEVHGRISVYESGGLYQLYAESIQPSGEGLLFQEFLRLKAELEAEGLFDEARKQPLPPWPRRIGVVTSPTGAALRDALNVLKRRFPLVEVVLAPTPVQGEEAPESIVRALQAVDKASTDVILLIRGGGSAEDLRSFNHEAVVRAVAGMKTPIISGIGHETDIILTDYAADRRAPTPSAAAELATPDRADLIAEIRNLRQALEGALQRGLDARRAALEATLRRLAITSPRAKVANARQRVDDLTLRALAALRHNLALARSGVRGMIQTLEAFGPAAVLERGYALVTGSGGDLIRSVRQVKQGDEIDVRLSDGSLRTRVERISPRKTDGEGRP